MVGFPRLPDFGTPQQRIVSEIKFMLLDRECILKGSCSLSWKLLATVLSLLFACSPSLWSSSYFLALLCYFCCKAFLLSHGTESSWNIQLVVHTLFLTHGFTCFLPLDDILLEGRSSSVFWVSCETYSLKCSFNSLFGSEGQCLLFRHGWWYTPLLHSHML